MDFSRLPEPAFLKIFEYLQLEDYFRASRVNKTFRQIGQLAVSRTKCLDLTEDRFRKLTPDQLAVLLDFCASNLERIKFGLHYRQMATTLAHYEYPRMIDIDLGYTSIDQGSFDQLIRNCPNVESLVSRNFDGFPTITNNNLKKLCLSVRNDASLRTLIGRCPNLEEMDLSAGYGITFDILDEFFASIQHAHRITINLVSAAFGFERAELVNFYHLPLAKLSIDFRLFVGDDFLHKVVTSFPNLRELRIGNLEPTNQGIALLAGLQELQGIHLQLRGNGSSKYDQGIRQLAHCQNLRVLNVFRSKISGGNLVNLIRSCPRLEYVGVWDITEVDTQEEAVVILDSLAGIPKREITIQFHWPSGGFEFIWKWEPTKAAIRKLEEEDGLKITIV